MILCRHAGRRGKSFANSEMVDQFVRVPRPCHAVFNPAVKQGGAYSSATLLRWAFDHSRAATIHMLFFTKRKFPIRAFEPETNSLSRSS
jgi:hypothetical protein